MTRNETEIADAHIQEKYMRIAHVGAILSIIHNFPSIIHYCLSTATFQVTVESRHPWPTPDDPFGVFHLR